MDVSKNDLAYKHQSLDSSHSDGRDRTLGLPLTVDELLSQPEPIWLIEKVLPASGMGLIWGKSGSGKSFIALDLACSLALGSEWCQLPVSAASVLYIALEGDTRNRIQSYLDFNDMESDYLDRLFFWQKPFDLLNKSNIENFISRVKSSDFRNIDVVILDTLNRASLGANENDSRDMGRIIQSAQYLNENLGCVLVLVHHSGKDQHKGARGHSSLEAAIDFAFKVQKRGSRISLQVTKERDAPDDYTLATLELINVSDSMVLVSNISTDTESVRLNPSEQQAFDLLKNLHCENQSEDGLVPRNVWRDKFVEARKACASKELKTASVHRSFNRAIEKLTDKSLIDTVAGKFRPLNLGQDETI